MIRISGVLYIIKFYQAFSVCNFVVMILKKINDEITQAAARILSCGIFINNYFSVNYLILYLYVKYNYRYSNEVDYSDKKRLLDEIIILRMFNL
jgi:hypothetical protein